MSDEPPYGAVLCAGYGTRMEPLTETVPKPLLPFLNAPILTYALDHLAAAGVERVGMNLHHLPEAVPPVADRLCGQFGLESTYAREWEILGTAGGVRGIWEALDEPEAPLIVSNGDTVMNIDLGRHLARHRETDAAATLVVRSRAGDQPGKVWLDAEEQTLRRLRDYQSIDQIDEADLEEYDFTGVHIVEPSVLDDIPLEPGDIIDEVYGPMLERGGPIRASVHEDFWAALDNPRLLFETTRRVLTEPDIFDQAPLDGEIREGVYAPDPDVFDGDVEVEPPVFCGTNVEIADGARLGPCAVVDGAEIGEDVEIENAIVYGVGDVQRSKRDCVAVSDRVAPLD